MQWLREHPAWIIWVLVAVFAATAVATRKQDDVRVEERFAWAQYTYDYSQHQWCVNAQLRAAPGRQVGGCWKTRREADEGILK